MTPRLTRRIRQLLRSAPVPDPRATDALEQTLLRQFELRHPLQQRARRRLVPLALGSCALVALAAMSRLPAEYGVDAGRRVEITLGEGQPLPDRAELQRLIGEVTGKAAGTAGGPGEVGPERASASVQRQVQVRVQRRPEGGATVEVSLWGDGLPPPDALLAQVRAHFPALDPAQLVVLPLDGHVHDTVAGKLRWKLFALHASDAQLHQAREALIASIRREEGEGAEVEVTVQDADGRRRVEVRVEKRVRTSSSAGGSGAGAPVDPAHPGQ